MPCASSLRKKVAMRLAYCLFAFLFFYISSVRCGKHCSSHQRAAIFRSLFRQDRLEIDADVAHAMRKMSKNVLHKDAASSIVKILAREFPCH
jgi:hypothetical protein